MNDPRILHREAMDFADRATLARRSGQAEQARELFRQAFERERFAAEATALGLEPTRSILHRSAASLALDCEDFRAAERLIAAALAGDPPSQIADELRDLMEMVHFQRHLDLRGIRLEADEFQFSIEGEGIGFGIAPAAQFVGRVRDMETLIYRTAERQLHRPFRESGRRKKSLEETLQLYVSVPRAASFAVTFRLGASEQFDIPGTSLPAAVVQEVLDCVDLANSGQMDILEARINDDAYFRNFLGLTQKIAPDGEVVRSVGFTSLGTGIERRVLLTTPKVKLVPSRPKPSPSLTSAGRVTTGTVVAITGTLLEADAKGQEHGQIEIRTSSGTIETVVVPRGMMRDIVRPLFEEEVTVRGLRVGGSIQLEAIGPADESQ